MRKWMTGVHGQWRQHWENLLLKVAIRPGCASVRQLGDFPHVNPVLCQLRHQLGSPKRVLRPHKLAHRLLNAVEQLRSAQAVGANITRLALDLLLDSGYANLEKFIEI